MNNFDKRWLKVTNIAHSEHVSPEPVPFAFARRVIARSFADKPHANERLWEQLIIRWLIGMAMVLAFCAIMELPHFLSPAPLETGVENTVAQVIWSL